MVAKEAGPATTAPSSPSTETSSETHEAPQVAAATKSKGKNKGGTRASSAAAAVPGLVQRGPLLLTRQGMSGPAVLKLSAFGARIMNSTNYKCDYADCLCCPVLAWCCNLVTPSLFCLQV